MNYWEPFNETARRAIVLAQEVALRHGGNTISSEQIVLGLLEVDESPLLPLFEERGLSIDSYADRVRGGSSPAEPGGAVVFTPDGKRLIELAFERARALGDTFLGAEHFVAALAHAKESLGARYLVELGFDLPAVEARMIEQLRSGAGASGAAEPLDVTAGRRSYLRFELHEDRILTDPLAQLNAWLQEAAAAQVPEANAMSVSTVDANGRPSSRIVLLRGVDDRGLVFYTSYLSRKGADLDINPKIAVLFYWAGLERQVRIEGAVERLAEEESDAYFGSRPRGHQLAAWASEQSEPVESRALLEQRIEDYRARFEGEDVPRPHSWGGYLVRPSRIEFWQGRENRMHDRLVFTKDGSTWKLQRLSP